MSEEMIEKEESAKPFEAPIEEEVPEADDLKPHAMTGEALDTFLAGEPVEVPPTPEGEIEKEEDPPPEIEGKVTDDTDDSDTISRDELDELMAENKRLLKKAENQDKFFDRMGTEVGILRKNTPEEEKAELERIRDIYYEDPIAGHRAMEEYHAKQNESATAQNEYQASQMVDANRESLTTIIPDFTKNQDEIVNELAVIMAEDNADSRAIDAFKKEPFMMDQSTLYNLYHRNIANKSIKVKDAKITELETQIEELKKRPGELLGKIEKASKTQTMTGKSAGAVPANSATVAKPASKMSKEELDKALAG